MPEWFRDENFWEKFYPFMFTDEKFEIAEEQTYKLLAFVAFECVTVLDLACGPGRHATALAKKGLQRPFLLSPGEGQGTSHRREGGGGMGPKGHAPVRSPGEL